LNQAIVGASHSPKIPTHTKTAALVQGGRATQN
jgi:hypothetical protein